MDPLEKLRARLRELTASNQTLIDKADGEGRDLTAEEASAIDANLVELDRVSADIARRERIAGAAGAHNQGSGRRTQPDGVANQNQAPPGGGRTTVPAAPNRIEAGTGGFRHLGEFAHCVRAASGPNPDAGALGRLQNAAANNEGTGSEGGFAVPPDYRTAIMTKVMGDDSLLPRTDQVQTTSNQLIVPKDEVTPWGSAGIQVYWEGEAAQATQSKMALEATTMRLSKLFGLVRVTDELLEDAPSLDGYLRSRAPIRIAQAINTAIVKGNGVSKPLGLLNSDARITVPKRTSQPADTVFHRNIVDMWSRMYAPCRATAVWLINQDVEPQLNLMSFRDIGSYPSTAAGTPVPVYVPAGNVAGSPFGQLMGRPVIPVQACPTVGDEGDIILADLSQYLTGVKGGGIRTDISMHLYFDFGQQAYRFQFRLAGQPWWNNPITPENSPSTLSCFVTLGAR